MGRDFRNLENVHLQMRGSEVFKVAVATLGQSVEECLSRFGHDKSEVDWLIPHQANVRIIQATARRLGLSMNQVVVTVDRHGNTSTASIPLALDAAVRDGRIQRGSYCCSKPLAAASPGVRRWSASDGGAAGDGLLIHVMA